MDNNDILTAMMNGDKYKVSEHSYKSIMIKDHFISIIKDQVPSSFDTYSNIFGEILDGSADRSSMYFNKDSSSDTFKDYEIFSDGIIK